MSLKTVVHVSPGNCGLKSAIFCFRTWVLAPCNIEGGAAHVLGRLQSQTAVRALQRQKKKKKKKVSIEALIEHVVFHWL